MPIELRATHLFSNKADTKSYAILMILEELATYPSLRYSLSRSYSSNINTSEYSVSRASPKYRRISRPSAVAIINEPILTRFPQAPTPLLDACRTPSSAPARAPLAAPCLAHRLGVRLGLLL